jgi:carbonic anhydrase
MSEKQNTLTIERSLFISCADCRLTPDLLFSVGDESLIVTNLANAVPPYQASTNNEVIASIEYGVCVQNLNQIVVCGHTQCQILESLLSSNDNSAATNQCLRFIRPALAQLSDVHLTKSQRLVSLVQSNIVLQMGHLRTYPFVAERITKHQLGIEGWLYDDLTGTVMHYHPENQTFQTRSIPN